MAEDNFADIDENRIVAMDKQSADDWQYSLRPHKLSEYIGQDKAKNNLSIFIQAAMKRGEAGSCAFIWSAWSWQNDISWNHCQ